MLSIRPSKIKKRSIQLKLPVDLVDALKEMGRDAARIGRVRDSELLPDGPLGIERGVKNMIECVLLWGVWSHSRGHSPDAQMLRQPNGYSECELILRARRERSEIEYLDRLYRLEDRRATPGGVR
jgi:hypothetical protein